MYFKKFKIPEAKLMRKLWGDNFYNDKEKKWSKSADAGYERGFNKYVLTPIFKVIVNPIHSIFFFKFMKQMEMLWMC